MRKFDLVHECKFERMEGLGAWYAKQNAVLPARGPRHVCDVEGDGSGTSRVGGWRGQHVSIGGQRVSVGGQHIGAEVCTVGGQWHADGVHGCTMA